jgi:hypothetical protein
MYRNQRKGEFMITKKDWYDSNESWVKFANPKDEISQEIFDYFLECMPPDEYSPNGFMVSEMYDFNEFGKGLYMAFVNFKGRYFYAGLMTKSDFRNNQLRIVQTILEHKRMEEI